MGFESMPQQNPEKTAEFERLDRELKEKEAFVGMLKAKVVQEQQRGEQGTAEEAGRYPKICNICPQGIMGA